MKIPVSKAYAKWMDEDADRLNAMAELARKVAVKLPSRKEAEKRAFCPTGPGGGIDNSCSSVSVNDPSLTERVPFKPADGKNSDFTRVPTIDELTEALTGSNSAKGTKIGSAKDLPAGTPVALRIDIPAFNYSTEKMGKAIYAVTVHEDKGGKGFGSPIGYEPVARLSGSVTFASKEGSAIKVATGKSAKFPLATVKGKFDPSRVMPPDIDSWTPVGYDPKKAAYFYDKKTGREVIGGTDAVSVGNSVFVRIPKYGYRNAKETYRDAGFWGIEYRAEDCGRDDGGKFDEKNTCAGEGGTATPDRPPVSTPGSSKMPRGKVGDPANSTSWLSPDGTFFPVPRSTPPKFRTKVPRGFMTHDEWASLHGHEDGEDGLLKAGWARVAKSGQDIYAQTIGGSLTGRQKKSLEDQSIMTDADSVVHDSAPSMAERGGKENKYKTIWSKNDRSFNKEAEGRAFCPTGEGGGVDNSCSAADAGAPSGGGGSGTSVASPQHFGDQSDSAGKISWDKGDGDPPFAGAEKFESVSVNSPRQVNESLDRIGIDPGAAIDIAGASAGGGYAMFRPSPEFSDEAPFAGSGVTPILLDFERDVAGVQNGLMGSSIIGVSASGKPVVYHNTISVMDAVRSDPIKRHAAAREFYRTMVASVEAARKNGISVVAFNAAGHSAADSAKGNANPWRGYTIWPRMGFDGPLPQSVRRRLPPELSHAKTLLDLHATREGTKWWAKNGEDIDVQLDLTRPDSEQNKVFDRFVRHFSKDRRDLPLGEGDGWLSPEDLARLDEMWEEIWEDDGTLDDYSGEDQEFLIGEKEEKEEGRSADCGRDESGKFAEGNSCQIGININDSHQDFTGQILAGAKTTETRITDSLKPYIGRTVGIVRTGKGKATLVGTMKIGRPKFYKTKKEFDADYDKHKVGPDSPHYIGKAGKYGYPLTEVKKVTPVTLDSKGIVARVVSRSADEETIEYSLPVEERAFCPTGEGGGIDNSCSAGEKMAADKDGGSGGLTNLGGKTENWGRSNETEIWTPDRPMFRGAEKIGEIMISRPADVRGVAEEVLGLSVPEIVTASGALIDGTDRANLSKARMVISGSPHTRGEGGGLSVYWRCAGAATGNGYRGDEKKYAPRPGTIVTAVEASRVIESGGVRNIDMRLDSYFIHPDFQGKGLALESVIRQTSIPGVEYISMGAGRQDSDNPAERMSGYWRWPLYGFNASMDAVRKRGIEVPARYSKARSLLDVYAMPGGIDWWREEGTDIGLVFDTTTRSQSRLVLLQLQEAARRKHGSRSIGMTGEDNRKTSADCDNDPDVESAWEAIAKKGLKQEAPGRLEELESRAEKFLKERAKDGRPPEVRPH